MRLGRTYSQQLVYKEKKLSRLLSRRKRKFLLLPRILPDGRWVWLETVTFKCVPTTSWDLFCPPRFVKWIIDE
jgi:hypothetical protein